MEHLVEAHSISPSMTPKVFSNYKTVDGINSYELLAQQLGNGVRNTSVLDLGCGDGCLVQYTLPKMGDKSKFIGLDMSKAELGIAKSTYTEDRATFFLAKAQKLPLADNSIDHVFSHMAFMLMLPIEPVVEEIARVLKPVGQFSAIIGNSTNKPDSFWREIQKFVSKFLFSYYEQIRFTKTGDSRVKSLDGLNSLFSESRFTSPQVSDFNLLVGTSPQNIWSILKDMYFTAMLPPEEKQTLEDSLMEFVSAHPYSKSNDTFEYPMRLLTLSRL